jgi:ATP-dependent Clp protease ATP-binding subunit ClpX
LQRKNLLRFVNAQDIKSFGLIPELLGRLPIITHLEPLDAVTLRSILTEPKNALIKQYTQLFAIEKIKLSIDNEVYDFIVEKAMEYKLGARGLRSICESLFTQAMFEMPGTPATEFNVTIDYAKKMFNKSKLSSLKVA